jgi:regulation of enolase protein 1 (concanavalin A-like superfamily)
MHRLAALLFCCALLAVAAVMAAPAPFPRATRQAGPWVDGWDRPVDPVGGSRFDRQGSKLTITVPGPGREFNVLAGRLTAPRLLRDVPDDFILQVRISGDFRDFGQGVEYREAGILLTDGKQFLPVGRTTRLEMFPPLKPIYFRLRHQGKTLRIAVSEDGKQWEKGAVPLLLEGWGPLKVGVYAAATTAGTFTATFDEFKLTPLGGKTR